MTDRLSPISSFAPLQLRDNKTVDTENLCRPTLFPSCYQYQKQILLKFSESIRLLVDLMNCGFGQITDFL